MIVAAPGAVLLRDIATRLGLMFIVLATAMAVLTVLVRAVGLPVEIGRAMIPAVALAAVFTRIHPPGTPHRWRKNAVAWSAHFVLGTATFLLGNRMWGA